MQTAAPRSAASASDRDYAAIVVGANQLKLGAVFQANAATPDQAVDTLRDTITFASAHNLVTGDQVYYHAAGSAVGGLVEGQKYIVQKIDDRTIKLALTAPLAAKTFSGAASPAATRSASPRTASSTARR